MIPVYAIHKIKFLCVLVGIALHCRTNTTLRLFKICNYGQISLILHMFYWMTLTWTLELRLVEASQPSQLTHQCWAIHYFLNLPLWANFYNYTDLSCSTTSTTFRPTNPIGWPQPQPSTSTLNQASPAAQVEAGWGWGWGWGCGWGGLRRVEAGWGLAYLAGSYWMTSMGRWGVLRHVEACLLGWNSVRFWPSQWTHHCIAIYDPIWRQIYRSFWSCCNQSPAARQHTGQSQILKFDAFNIPELSETFNWLLDPVKTPNGPLSLRSDWLIDSYHVSDWPVLTQALISRLRNQSLNHFIVPIDPDLL